MADIVIVPAGLIEEANGSERPYTEHLSKKAGAEKIPPAPAREFRNADGSLFLFLLEDS